MWGWVPTFYGFCDMQVCELRSRVPPSFRRRRTLQSRVLSCRFQGFPQPLHVQEQQVLEQQAECSFCIAVWMCCVRTYQRMSSVFRRICS